MMMIVLSHTSMSVQARLHADEGSLVTAPPRASEIHYLQCIPSQIESEVRHLSLLRRSVEYTAPGTTFGGRTY